MAANTETNARPPVIRLTEAAVEKLREVVASQDRPVAGLRLEIIGRMGGEFQHVLSLAMVGTERPGDVRVETEGLCLLVDSRTAPYVDEVEIHYEFQGQNVSGLKYTNPNPLWLDEREIQIQDIFDNHINPAIESHGGWVMLLGVEGTTAFVELGGGCQGCGMADVTLKQGIEATILREVEGIERVVDQTDHDAGQNPYHKPSKK